jgi:hypothetical protein
MPILAALEETYLLGEELDSRYKEEIKEMGPSPS